MRVCVCACVVSVCVGGGLDRSWPVCYRPDDEGNWVIEWVRGCVGAYVLTSVRGWAHVWVFGVVVVV